MSGSSQCPSRFATMAAALSVTAVVAIGGATSGVAAAKTKHHAHKPARKALQLGGTWTGKYTGGKYSGNFTLSWKQTGTKLSGSLKLSNPSGSYDCTGTINGSSIQFGAVSVGATYTGSVSNNGKSMSGNWKSPVDSGSWSATKS